MSYTPAPWTVFKTQYKTISFYVLSSKLPGAVAHIPSSTVAPMEANARLISAAPELLECLEFIVNNHSPRMASILFGEGWVDHARNVINKAKGETQ